MKARKLLNKLNIKIYVNIIFYQGSLPKILKLCELCNKYKSIELFNNNNKICNKCKYDDPKATLKTIIKEVCRFEDITIEEIQNRSRKREYVETRQKTMYFAEKFTGLTFENIGKMIGDKDHSTVSCAIKTVNNLIDTDKYYKKSIELLRKRILKKLSKNIWKKII